MALVVEVKRRLRLVGRIRYHRYNRNRFLQDNSEDIPIDCTLISNESEKIYAYNCSYDTQEKNYTSFKVLSEEIKLYNEGEDPDKSKITVEAAPLAAYLGEHITEEKNLDHIKLLNNSYVLMENSKIVNHGDNIIIEGTINNGSMSLLNPYILIKDNDNTLKNYTYELIPLKDGKNRYQMIIVPDTYLKANLDKSFGRFNETHNLMLSFEDDDNGGVEFNPNKGNKFNRKESSQGLSAGTIVGIILPCLAAIIAIIIVAIVFLRKPKITPAPMESITTNVLSASNAAME